MMTEIGAMIEAAHLLGKIKSPKVPKVEEKNLTRRKEVYLKAVEDHPKIAETLHQAHLDLQAENTKFKKIFFDSFNIFYNLLR